MCSKSLIFDIFQLLKERASELSSIVAEELGCSSVWASINFHATLEIIEQVTALITSGILSGLIPETESPDSLALIFKDPLGVVLGIAPWNAPAMLGMRSVAAAVAAGNCAILKVILITVYIIISNSHTDFTNQGIGAKPENALLHRQPLPRCWIPTWSGQLSCAQA